MILSDVLRPNIQRLQDHRANLGINAAEGIQMLVFFEYPESPDMSDMFRLDSKHCLSHVFSRMQSINFGPNNY